MGDVTGPTNKLPGHSHIIPNGTKCDLHDDRLAVKRIQGETDSFGSELEDMCQECFDECVLIMAEYGEEEGTYDWCKKAYKNKELRPTRDITESSSGPVYYACSKCINTNIDSL